ncbi:hypothetical protein LINPERHAP1_LOCUS8545 [Linum perenne]
MGTNFNPISISESSREEVSYVRINGLVRLETDVQGSKVAMQLPTGGFDNDLEKLAERQDNKQSGGNHNKKKGLGFTTDLGNDSQGIIGDEVSEAVVGGDFFIAKTNHERLNSDGVGHRNMNQSMAKRIKKLEHELEKAEVQEEQDWELIANLEADLAIEAHKEAKY